MSPGVAQLELVLARALAVLAVACIAAAFASLAHPDRWSIILAASALACYEAHTLLIEERGPTSG